MHPFTRDVELFTRVVAMISRHPHATSLLPQRWFCRSCEGLIPRTLLKQRLNCAGSLYPTSRAIALILIDVAASILAAAFARIAVICSLNVLPVSLLKSLER
jgi:hypothetical protein